MITCKFDFNPDDFEKAMLKQLMDDIKKKLVRGGVRGVTVKVDRNHKMNFEGPEEEIAKVTKILGL